MLKLKLLFIGLSKERAKNTTANEVIAAGDGAKRPVCVSVVREDKMSCTTATARKMNRSKKHYSS